jgi:hypothetical protein
MSACAYAASAKRYSPDPEFELPIRDPLEQLSGTGAKQRRSAYVVEEHH